MGLPKPGLAEPLLMLGEREPPKGTWLAGLSALSSWKVGGRLMGELPLIAVRSRVRVNTEYPLEPGLRIKATLRHVFTETDNT